MPVENGLNRIYRFGAIGLSFMLSKITKRINPNAITVTGFIVFFLGWIQYLLFFLLSEFLFLPKIIFLITIQIALLIDYADGEYANRVNRTSRKGHYLDGTLDFMKISLTYFLVYFITENQFEKLLILITSVAFTFYVWSRSNLYRENIGAHSTKEGKFLSITLLFSFSVAHQYLYFSIFLLFGIWLILILQITLGFGFAAINLKKVFNYVRKFDKNSNEKAINNTNG
ncbi:MAG: CDP-alcohol phosphatidyltransferase family protein [Promethearchaeota archaeon]